MAATGSTQRYKRQLDQLEHSLTAKLQELSILEQENEVLKAQERALSSFISSVEGGVAVTAHMLKKQASTGAAAAAAALEGQAGSTAAAAGSSATADAELLQIIESKEREIQMVLQQLEAGPYEELYSTLLLRTAATNAEATAQLLATPPKQRRQNWRDRVQQIALLLPKYDYPELGSFSTAAAAAAAASGVSLHTPGSSSRGSSSSGSSAQVVVDGLVDDLATVLLVTGLLDPPQMTLYNFMVNMSTNMVVDSYPEGFWQHVAQGLQLSDKQRSALHISWNRIKAEKLALTAQHEDVLARLNQIRALLRQQSKQFEEETHQVMQQPPDPHDEIVQRRQQQQDFFAWQQRQQQQQRRQQQQCEGVGVQGDSQDPRFTCDHKCDLDCDHRSDLDLDLGHTLDDLDLGVSEIQDLLRDMTNDDDHQHQWLLLQEIDGQQQQQPDQPPHADHQGLATSDVFTLAVTALTHDVTNGLDDSPRQPAAAAVTRQQQQQQQPNDAPIKLVLQEQQQSKPAQSSSPQQQQQQQQQQELSAIATASSTSTEPGSSSHQQQQQEQIKPKEDLPPDTTQQQQQSKPPSDAQPQQQQQQQQYSLPSNAQPQQQQQQQSSLPSDAHPQQQQQQQQVDTSPLLNWQEIATQLQDVQQQLGACTEQHEHFVPVGSKEQQQLERELNRIRGKIKMQHYCSALFWVNTLSKKQLATLYVLSWPFMPDGFALSEQLEADRTPSTSAGTTKSS